MTWLAAAGCWAGSTLLLSAVRPLHRPSIGRRLRPYVVARAGGSGAAGRTGAMVILAERWLGRTSLGDPLAARLSRADHPLDPPAFRLRQVTHAVLALAGAGALAAVAPVTPGPFLTGVLVLGSPVVAVVGHETALDRSARARTDRVVRELPTVAEQLAMLLGAGRSVPAALAELATRGRGACAADLRRVGRRIRQGVGDEAALREWADLRPVPAVSHLVAVLTLAGETTELDRLVEQEAEAIRADAHRDLLASLERRGQQVWVPVTVATLLPGSLLLLVPFLDALRLFAGA